MIGIETYHSNGHFHDQHLRYQQAMNWISSVVTTIDGNPQQAPQLNRRQRSHHLNMHQPPISAVDF